MFVTNADDRHGGLAAVASLGTGGRGPNSQQRQRQRALQPTSNSMQVARLERSTFPSACCVHWRSRPGFYTSLLTTPVPSIVSCADEAATDLQHKTCESSVHILCWQKLEARVNAGQLRAGVSNHVMDSLGDDGFSMTNDVATAFRVGASKQLAVTGRTRDKSDRATVEQVRLSAACNLCCILHMMYALFHACNCT